MTDVAAVTGQAEMLDGRVKTLHPAIHGGILADRRRAAHREALSEASIDPFELVVVNLYPFADAAERPGISDDELIEEIDIGGPAMVRAAAKNHANVGIVTDPDGLRGRAGRDPLADGRLSEALGGGWRWPPSGTPPATTPASRPSSRRRRLDGGGARGADASTSGDDAADRRRCRRARCRRASTCPSTRALDLRYGENPHQSAAMYLLPDADPASGPFARRRRRPRRQGR